MRGHISRHLVLVGMMGAGKTTVGAALGRETGAVHYDTDVQIEKLRGKSVAEIFTAEGEEAFRALEAEVLSRCLTGRAPNVISVGGGAVMTAACRDSMRTALVVWLRADMVTLLARVGDGAGRPLLASGPMEALTKLMAQREPLYAQVADMVVDVGGRTTGEVVSEILIGAAELTSER